MSEPIGRRGARAWKRPAGCICPWDEMLARCPVHGSQRRIPTLPVDTVAKLREDLSRARGSARSLFDSLPFSAPENLSFLIRARLGWLVAEGQEREPSDRS